MRSSISCAGLSIDRTDVHVIGGYRHTGIWHWKSTDDHYCLTGEDGELMLKERCDLKKITYWPLVVRDVNNIYALGGATCAEWIDAVQKYNIEENKWEEFETLPFHATAEESGAVFSSGILYIFTPERVMILDPSTKVWQFFKHMEKVNAFGAVIFEGRILVIASDNVFEYQPESYSFKSLNKKIPADYVRNVFVN